MDDQSRQRQLGRLRLALRPELLLPDALRHAARASRSKTRAIEPFGQLGGFWYHFEYERHADAVAVFRTPGFTPSGGPAKPTLVADRTSPRTCTLWDGNNLSEADNYHILEATGRGHLVGLHLQIENIGGGWYGEGDDMLFVDQAPGDWPPRYHGTGTEEIFGGGASPSTPYSGPYTGFHLVEAPDYSRRTAMYRWYLHDPVRFERSLRFSIEHGHANNFENDYASVAYWYQTEPHAAFPALPSAAERLTASVAAPTCLRRPMTSTASRHVDRLRLSPVPGQLRITQRRELHPARAAAQVRRGLVQHRRQVGAAGRHHPHRCRYQRHRLHEHPDPR